MFLPLVVNMSTDIVKIAVTWKLNEFKLYLNGSLVGTDTSGNTPVGLNNLSFREPNGANPFFGKTKALAVWKIRFIYLHHIVVSKVNSSSLKASFQTARHLVLPNKF